MTFAQWMLPVAALLPYLTIAAAKASRSRYDNAAPRTWAGTLQGWRQRADWAHRNHFEAFPPFAAAVLLSSMTGAGQGGTNVLAAGFIAARVGYTAAYLFDRPALRSAFWFAGVGCVIALFARAA